MKFKSLILKISLDLISPIISGLIVAAIIAIVGHCSNINQRVKDVESQIGQMSKTIPEIKTLITSEIHVNISQITDQKGNEIKRDSAPFIVSVKGTVSNGHGKYLYLVVDDGNFEFIEPGLGFVIENNFTGNCYLGLQNSSQSLKKWYKIYAVVTVEKHEPYEHLRRETVITKSETNELFRKY